MGRFTADEADNYGKGSGGSYFSLKNDGDVAKVRFMYNGMSDVEGMAVHEIEADTKIGKAYVNCLRSYNEPKSNCPLCANGSMQKAKLFIPLYDEEEKCVKLWERGKNFFPKISSLCSRYSSSKTPLVSHIFEIERNGKPGDTQTTYEIYETGCDETTLEDLPELPEVLGTKVLDKSFEELEYYVEHEEFPRENANSTRRSNRNEDEDERPTGRRTPAGRRGDGF